MLLVVKAIFPLAMSKHPMVAGRPTATHDYIPGAALRGAVAAEYLKNNSADSGDFQSLFLSDQVKWGNLYPVNKILSPSLPLPATALSCKRVPGFLQDDEDYLGERRHGVKDCLLEHIMSKCLQEKRYSHEKCEYSQGSGGNCPHSTDGYRGFYQIENGAKKTVRVSKRLDTHTAIDPETLSAKYEAIFAMEVIGEGQEFMGFVDRDNSDLENRIGNLLPLNKCISVGNDRSRGLGLIEILDYRSESLEVSLSLPDLETRLGSLPNISGDLGFFTIFLCSDAIIMDSFLRHQTYIDRETLNHSLENTGRCLPEGVELDRAYTSSYMIYGWNTIGRLPKHVDIAIQKGSVFVFSYPKKEEKQVIQCLKQIEGHGIGERRNEGFGKVIICNPFHQEVSQNGRQ